MLDLQKSARSSLDFYRLGKVVGEGSFAQVNPPPPPPATRKKNNHLTCRTWHDLLLKMIYLHVGIGSVQRISNSRFMSCRSFRS